MDNPSAYEQGADNDEQKKMIQYRKPAQLLQESLHFLPKGRALDIAAGSGRNALYLAEHGFSVHAIERDQEALQALQDAARERSLRQVTVEVMDLEGPSLPGKAFPMETYDVALIFFYLFRPLFPAFLRTLKPGGLLMYETFLLENYVRYNRPRRAAFCLASQELLVLASGLHVLHYDEGERIAGNGRPPTYTARLLARKNEA